MARRRKTKRSSIKSDKSMPPASQPINMPPKSAVETNTTPAPTNPLAGLPLELRWMVLKHLAAYPNSHTDFCINKILTAMHKVPAFEHDFATLFLPQQILQLKNPRFLESKWLDRLSRVVQRSVLVLDLTRCLDSATVAQTLRALSRVRGLKRLRVVFHTHVDLGVSVVPLVALVIKRGSEVDEIKVRVLCGGMQVPAGYRDVNRHLKLDDVLKGLIRKRVSEKGRGFGMLRELVCE